MIGNAFGQEEDAKEPSFSKDSDGKNADVKCLPVSRDNVENSQLPKIYKQRIAQPIIYNEETQQQKQHNPSQNCKLPVQDNLPPKHFQRYGHIDIPAILADKSKDQRVIDSGQVVPTRLDGNLALEVDDFDIPWSDLVLKERIGAGIFIFIFLT